MHVQLWILNWTSLVWLVIYNFCLSANRNYLAQGNNVVDSDPYKLRQTEYLSVRGKQTRDIVNLTNQRCQVITAKVASGQYNRVFLYATRLHTEDKGGKMNYIKYTPHGPLCSSSRKLYYGIALPTLWQEFGEDPLLCQQGKVHKDTVWCGRTACTEP